MKKKIKKNSDGKAKMSYTYILNDRTTMKEDAIRKRKIKFNQLYINTIKHEEDVRRWIESGKRKKGDIRRSLEGLDDKYNELANLKDDYEKKGIFEIKKLKNKNDQNYNLEDLNNRIINLYNLAGERRKSIYIREKEEIDFVAQKARKLKLFEMFSIRKNSSKEKSENKKQIFKIGRRIAAFAMAISMALFAGTRVGDTEKYTNQKETKSYTDTDNRKNDKNNFKESLYVEAAREVEKEKNNIEKNKENPFKNDVKEELAEKDDIIVNNEEEIKDKYIDDANEYLAIEGTKYSEASDGSGNIGYFSKDTEVKVYNRSLVKTDENGNKQILEVSKVGQTWKEYAEEKGLDYDEFKEYMNNKNVKKYVSLDSIDGTKSYGWVLEDTLEKIGEVER